MVASEGLRLLRVRRFMGATVSPGKATAAIIKFGFSLGRQRTASCRRKRVRAAKESAGKKRAFTGGVDPLMHRS